jgi:hypothetical protein
MPIPESQLETWSHQGSVTQSSDTYNTLKLALNTDGTPYASKDYVIFLQGSYGNDTNIYSESDVDVVIRLNSCFQHDLSNLPEDQKKLFKDSHSDATYTHVEFKNDVIQILRSRFGRDVDAGEKAIAISANGNRRKSDVIAAIQYKRFIKFSSFSDQSFDDGICFYTKSGQQIVNYPKQHSENLTRKHKATSQWFKPMARILKNMRRKMTEEGIIDSGVAPSYYLEGLLYNVPDNLFGKSFQETFTAAINWIHSADRTKFICANAQYYLLHTDSPVTWRADKCEAFLNGAIELWEQW